MKDPHPNRNADEAQAVYDNIPSIRERAAMRNLANNTFPGQRVENAASTPYVDSHQTRHEPMTGMHDHDHAAYDGDSHDDGIHTHTHSHHGDADHNHFHRPGVGNE